MMRKTVNGSLLDQIEEQAEIIAPVARLVELGRRKGFVTLDDILSHFPEAENDVDQLEEAFAMLMSAGIPFLDESMGDFPFLSQGKPLHHFLSLFMFIIIF